MEKVKLILVEGLPGSGKSTTTYKLEQYIKDIGSKVKAYNEFDMDNPIRSWMVDSIRFNNPEMEGSFPDQGPDGIAVDQSVYSIDQWTKLSERINKSQDVVILESRYWQNSLGPALLMGTPEEKVIEEFKQIYMCIKESASLLIYLKPLDMRTHLLNLLSTRGASFAEFFTKTISDAPWSQVRNLNGQDAFVGFFEEWGKLTNNLFVRHHGDKIQLSDPHLDWNKTLTEIYEKVDLSI